MNYKLYLQNSNDGITYDITEIAQQITVKKSVDGSAGQLTCVLEKDPNGLIKSTNDVGNGSTIVFETVDENDVFQQGIFWGYVFKVGTDIDENYKITAYDQLRYLKNSDIYTFRTETASQIFEKICKDYDLRYEVKTPTAYTPPAYSFVNKSLYSIIKKGMDLASINDRTYYYIIDNFGTIEWSNFTYEGEQLSFQLGENTAITSFTYEKSIDSDTYNRIKIYREGQDKTLQSWIVYDSNNITKWGILQLLKQADEKMNYSEIREQAENYLTTKNREVTTLKLQGEGVLECIAGKRIRFTLDREGIDKWMWIKSSTHTFTKYQHTMDLEVEV